MSITSLPDLLAEMKRTHDEQARIAARINALVDRIAALDSSGASHVSAQLDDQRRALWQQWSKRDQQKERLEHALKRHVYDGEDINEAALSWKPVERADLTVGAILQAHREVPIGATMTLWGMGT